MFELTLESSIKYILNPRHNSFNMETGHQWPVTVGNLFTILKLDIIDIL